MPKILVPFKIGVLLYLDLYELSQHEAHLVKFKNGTETSTANEVKNIYSKKSVINS